MNPEHAITAYREGRIDFKQLVVYLNETYAPDESYRLAITEERKKMERVSLRARAIAATDQQVWGE